MDEVPCPSCGARGRAEKVSVIVARETAVGPAVRLQTVRASRLSTPPPPVARRGEAATLLAINIALGLIGVPLAARGSIAGGCEVMGMALVNVCVAGIEAHRERARARRGRATWRRRVARWHRLYHCARCDRVFFPDHPQRYPVSALDNVLDLPARRTEVGHLAERFPWPWSPRPSRVPPGTSASKMRW